MTCLSKFDKIASNDHYNQFYSVAVDNSQSIERPSSVVLSWTAKDQEKFNQTPSKAPIRNFYEG